MAEILSGGLNWGSTQQAIVTMDKEGHPLTCCNPVTGECLGGGGSSDFSTAEVTIKYFDTDTPYSFAGVGVYEGVAQSTGANLHNLGEDWAGELLVNSWVNFETAIVNVTVTGDIEVVEIFDGGHACLIHGDGVITITSVTAPVLYRKCL